MGIMVCARGLSLVSDSRPGGTAGSCWNGIGAGPLDDVASLPTNAVLAPLMAGVKSEHPHSDCDAQVSGRLSGRHLPLGFRSDAEEVLGP